jgi:transcriptional regulator MraZ
MFRGLSKVTLDTKGRMAIPSRYRDRIISRSEGQLILTVDRRDTCLLLYPLPDWEEIERKLTRLPIMHRQSRRLQRLMQGHATEADMDGHGRILVPGVLREFAGLDKQGMLVGQGNRFELWDEERWTNNRAEWLAEEDDEFSNLPPELESLFF